MVGQSTGKTSSRKAKQKPAKPYDEFPMYAHASGRWAKKIGRHFYYFGRWGSKRGSDYYRVEGDGWKEALEVYKARIDDIQAGNVKPGVVTLEETAEGLTVKRLCDLFYASKKRQMDSGELSRAQLREYDIVAKLIVSEFGRQRLVTNITPTDFGKLRATMAERWGPVRLVNSITRTKTIFRFAFENEHIEKPIRYGTEFEKPAKATLRKHKAEGGKKIFTRGEVLSLLDAAETPLKAMILLGINAAFGNTDVATLKESDIDFDAGVIDFPRPKTGIERRAKLWPETVTALQAVIASRPEAKDPADDGLVFLTRRGTALIRMTEPSRVDNVAHAFSRLMKLPQCPECGTLQTAKKPETCEACKHEPKQWGHINGRRRLGFYSLRHTFRTVADAARDPVAIDLVMGHTDASMASHYRHGIEDERLEVVSQMVREWLYGGAK